MSGGIAAEVDITEPLAARIVVPDTLTGRALLVWHGGAWCVGGGAERYAERAGENRALCRDLGAVVVDVNYALVPAATFPSQTRDAAAALNWIADGMPGITIGGQRDAALNPLFETRRIAVHATSSGAQAVMSMLLAARDGALDLQLIQQPAAAALIVPSLDLRTEARLAGRTPEDAARALAVRDQYFAGVTTFTDPLVSPALAPDLTGLPPVTVALGEFDPLRPAGELFCRRAQEQGATIRRHVFATTHTEGSPEVMAARYQAIVADLDEWLAG